MKIAYNIVMLTLTFFLSVLCYNQSTELYGLFKRFSAARERTVSTSPSHGDDMHRPMTGEVVGVEHDASEPNTAVQVREFIEEASTPDIDKLKIPSETWRARYVKLSEDPKRQALLESAWTIQMDRTYGPLFRWFELTPDELIYFKSLLIEKKSINTAHNAQKYEPGLNWSDLMLIEGERKAEEAEIDAWIIEFLGRDVYGDYLAYEKSQPEREMLGSYKQALSNLDIGLSQGQEDSLIQVMYDERMTSHRLKDLFAGTDVMTDFSEANLRELLQEFDNWRTRVSYRAAHSLTPDQTAMLDEHLALHRDVLFVQVTAAHLMPGY